MSLGETIRITRQKSFYTQEEFARKLNVALSTVNPLGIEQSKTQRESYESNQVFLRRK